MLSLDDLLFLSENSSSANSHWIQRDTCCKWRKFNGNSKFPGTFTCSDAGQTEPFNTCEAALEDGVPLSYGSEKGNYEDGVPGSVYDMLLH
jgi:hypothetical protein